MRLEDGESQWKSEREERKEETSRKSETVRLAIINHIRSWRPPRILATRQTLRLPSVRFPSCSSSLVTLITHTAPGRILKSGCSLGLFLNRSGCAVRGRSHSFCVSFEESSNTVMTENLKNATFGFAFTASLPGRIRHPQKTEHFQYSRQLPRVYFILSLFHCERSPHKSCLKL